MASTRKSRNVNKRFKVFEDWSEKDETPPKKSRTRVRSYFFCSSPAEQFMVLESCSYAFKDFAVVTGTKGKTET